MKTYESPKIRRASLWLGGAIIGLGVVTGGTAMATYGLAELEAAQGDVGHQALAYDLRQEGNWLLPRELAVGGLVVLAAAVNAAKVSADYDRQRAFVSVASYIPPLIKPECDGMNAYTARQTYEPD